MISPEGPDYAFFDPAAQKGSCRFRYGRTREAGYEPNLKEIEL